MKEVTKATVYRQVHKWAQFDGSKWWNLDFQCTKCDSDPIVDRHKNLWTPSLLTVNCDVRNFSPHIMWCKDNITQWTLGLVLTKYVIALCTYNIHQLKIKWFPSILRNGNLRRNTYLSIINMQIPWLPSIIRVAQPPPTGTRAAAAGMQRSSYKKRTLLAY